MSAPEQGLARLPLPTPDEYFFAGLAVAGDVEAYGYRKGIRTRVAHYAQGPLGNYRLAAYNLANEYLLPVDSALGADPHGKVPELFYDGTLAGAAIVQHAHHERVPFLSLLGGKHRLLPEGVASFDDPLDLRHRIGDALGRQGDEGLELMGQETGELLSDLAVSHIANKYGSEYLRDMRTLLRGCGYVVLRAANFHRAILDADMQQFKADVEKVEQSGADWDGALHALPDSGENS